MKKCFCQGKIVWIKQRNICKPSCPYWKKCIKEMKSDKCIKEMKSDKRKIKPQFKFRKYKVYEKDNKRKYYEEPEHIKGKILTKKQKKEHRKQYLRWYQFFNRESLNRNNKIWMRKFRVKNKKT